MILHRVHQDTAIDYDWTDSNDLPVAPDAVEFVVRDSTGAVVADIGTVTMSSPYPVSLALADDEALSEGNYSYILRGQVDGVWTILSAGLLRVKDDSPELVVGP